MILPHFLFQTGKMTDKDGSVYDGEWKDDMRNGKGEDSPAAPGGWATGTLART